MSKATDFIKKITPYAESAERLYGVPAAFLIAQAGIESRWGSDETVKYNNVFGVKAFSNWTGKKVTLPADGGMAEFRWYKDLNECFNEQGKLLTGNLYKPALAWKANLWHYAKTVQTLGYCPNTKYADLILEIAEDFQLIPLWKIEFEKAKSWAETSGIVKPDVPTDLSGELTTERLLVMLYRIHNKGGVI